MHIVISGVSGLIGSALAPMLSSGGHCVTPLVRGAAGEGQFGWQPEQDQLDVAGWDGVDAVIHLAGAPIARRWTAGVKEEILRSRVVPTGLLSRMLARMARPPRVLLCASAIGIYGDRREELLDESSLPGTGFLAEVGRQWEAAAEPARAAGIRVVHLRFGLVLSPRGGALAKMLPAFRWGAGGPIGSGRQIWSWVALDDALGAIHRSMMDESLCGPLNVVAPLPVTCAEFARTLGRVLHRPALLPVPAAAVRLAFGEMANEALLASTRVMPSRLIKSGYHFQFSDLESALRHLLGR